MCDIHPSLAHSSIGPIHNIPQTKRYFFPKKITQQIKNIHIENVQKNAKSAKTNVCLKNVIVSQVGTSCYEP